MYIDIQERNNYFHFWVRNEDQALEYYREPAYYFCYLKSPNGDLSSLFGDRVKRIDFDDRRQYEQFVDSKPEGMIFESDFSNTQKFLSETFYGLTDSSPHVGFFDIEVDFDLNEGKGHPLPQNPFGIINSVSLYDKARKEYHMIMLTDDHSVVIRDDEDHLPVHNHHCTTEKHLLDTFVRLIRDIDILSAWNGDSFDIAYLIERMKIHYGQSNALKKLCRNNFKAYGKETTDQYDNEIIEYKLKGRQHLDTLKLYKRFSQEEKDSHALDNIVQEELGKEKLEYPGDLGALYRNDPQTFFEYSFHDTRLLKWLDEKLNHVALAVRMTWRGCVQFNDIFGSVKLLEGTIRNHCHFDRQQPIVLPNKKDNDNADYPGAIVLPTKPNVYGWTMTVDLGALYPSVIRSLGISPETYIMQCQDGHSDFKKVIERSTDEIRVTTVDQQETFLVQANDLYDMIKESGYTISAHGSLFRTDQIGIIPEVLAVWQEYRDYYKEQRDNAETDVIRFQNELNQLTEKLNSNSLYGTIAEKSSRFFNINLASSITLTGREIAKHQAGVANDLIESLEKEAA